MVLILEDGCFDYWDDTTFTIQILNNETLDFNEAKSIYFTISQGDI